jgi:ribosomal RNA-processing protein 1
LPGTQQHFAKRHSFDSPDDPRTPASLAYHISEIYLSELDKVLVEPSEDAFPAPTLLLVEPFLAILASSSSKNKYKHVHDGVLEPLFEILDVEKDASEASDDEEDTRPRKRVKSDPEAKLSHLRIHSALEPHSKSPANAAVLRKALSKRVFAVASADGTRDANRRRLYGFLKTVGADGEDEDDEDI